MEKATAIIREVLTVKNKTYLSPHLIRVTLTGDGVKRFSHTTIGANNKIFIPPAGLNEVHFPTFDTQQNQWIHPDAHLRPTVRTYTHSGIDLAKNEMYIDFVAHGESGPASAWAIHAKPGQLLGVAMRDSDKALCPIADWYLLVGDATAIPVLSALLGTLPAGTRGLAILEVHGKEDELPIPTHTGIEVRWLHNPFPESGSQLPASVRSVSFPSKPDVNQFGYVAAEFSAVSDIRNYLRQEQGWENTELYAYAYWKAGVAEDHSMTERAKQHRET